MSHKGLHMAETAIFQILLCQRTRVRNAGREGNEGGGGEWARRPPRIIRAKEHVCGGVDLLLIQFQTCSLLLGLPFYPQGHCSSLGCGSK